MSGGDRAGEIALDVAVIGAGTAGSAAARALARAGWRVGLCDARPFAEAGARWANGVQPWMFDRAHVPRPVPPELRGRDQGFVLLGPSGHRYLSIRPNPVWSADMRALVARLQDDARAAGAQTFEAARVVDVEIDDAGRPRAITLRRSKRSRQVLRARLFVDASGMAGVLRGRVPGLLRDCVPPGPGHVCSAAQAVCQIDDPAGAEAFADRSRARTGDVVCRLGVSGGYSIESVGVEPGAETVELLTGAIASPAYESGPRLMKAARRRLPWVGEPLFGGAGAIPLRRPYDRLSAPGLVLVGDAGCQVFPAHGSGIGAGLMAAQILAESLEGRDDPGDLAATWAYQAAFQREVGGLLAAYDLFRRASQSLDTAEVELLLRSGLVNQAGYRAGLAQVMPSAGIETLIAAGRGALRAPRLARKLLPAVLRMAPVAALYRRYPREPSDEALRRWSWAAARLFGEQPDICR